MSKLAMINRTMHRRDGLSLAEVVVSTLLVGLLMVASLQSLAASARTNSDSVSVGQAMMLARQLLDEVTSLHYEDPDQTPVWGLESGENVGKLRRAQADDIDDLDGWREQHVEDRTGDRIDEFSNWSRKITVEEIDLDSNLSQSPMASGSDVELRRITVTVTGSDKVQTIVSALRAKEGGALQSQGMGQELVTWVGITLTPSNGSPITAGSSLLNHASDQ